MYGTSWQVKLASHNNDTIMATDVDELVDVFVFLIVCIVVAMKAAVDENTVPNPSRGSLLDSLIAAMEREIEKLTEVLDSCPTDLKFLRKLAEFRILFFVVEGFAQIHPFQLCQGL